MSDWEAELDQETPKTIDNKNSSKNKPDADDDWENELNETETKVKTCK